MTRRERQCGFTLIELLVACALMAILAVLSFRGLDSVIQSRARLVQASDELRSLTLALSQLDEDLLRSWPVNQMKLNEPYLRIVTGGERNEQTIRLLREVNRTGFPTRVQRVIYQVRDGQLARGFSEFGNANAGTDGSSLGGGGGGGVGGAVQALVWQPVLSGVRGITIRGWVDGRGWLNASTLAGVTDAAAQLEASTSGAAASAASGAAGGIPADAAAAAASAAQAAAMALAIVGLEVVVERMDGQRFLRVYSIRD